MNIYLSVLSLLFVCATASPMKLGGRLNKKKLPEGIEMAVICDHTAVDHTPISENIVSSFLFEPEEY